METVNEYIAQIPDDRKDMFLKLRNTILDNLPNGFEECFSYKMLGYVVPFSDYPNGYHCNPKLNLPFIYLAAQKNFIALYHMGIYLDKKLLNWFIAEYPKHASTKLDIGKSCIRFKKEIPYELIGQLIQKMSIKDWIEKYSAVDPRNKK